ncbi:MAG: phage tail protein [Deltaproteobacteria bacterium]|nr:phage tail protein [Deltaproteobacteria bacterium]
MEPFIATIILFAGNFAPRGWEFCNGQLLLIAQNSALFSLIGTAFGGDGTTTFALPDLRGRVPVHAGAGPSLSMRTLGERFGAESVTLTSQQVPAHTHGLQAEIPPDGAMAVPPPTTLLGYQAIPGAATGTIQTAPAGGGMPVSIVQPSLALNYIIATQGIYPSRR